MEYGGIENRTAEVVDGRHLCAVEPYAHLRSAAALVRLVKVAVDGLLQETEAVAVEGYGAMGGEPLPAHAQACDPFPSAVPLALEGDFLAQHGESLPLLKQVDGVAEEVLVHQHAVLQALQSCYGIHHEAPALPLDVEACVEHPPAVAALLVACDAAYIVGVGLLALHGAQVVVGVTALIRIVVGHREVHLEVAGRFYDAAQAPSSAFHLVLPLMAEIIVPQSAAAVIVSSGAESQLVAYAVIVGDGDASLPVGGGEAHLEVGALVVEGILGVNPYESAHRVTAVESALRSAQDVDALDVVEGEVEGALVEVGHVVHVQAYGRGVDSGADAADIYRRGEA